MKKVLTILVLVSTELYNFPILSVFAQEQASPSAAIESQEATASAAVEAPPVSPPLSSFPTPPQPLFQPPIKSISLSELTNAALQDGSSRLPSAGVRKQKKLRRLLRKDFKAEEEVTMVVENATEEELSISMTDSMGKSVEAEVETLTSGDLTTIQVFPPRRHFTPGKYTVTIHDTQTNESFNQDFTWGVLAINTNKSIYHPKETARLSLAVLDERGEMVCDAKLELRIKNQSRLNRDQELRIDETLSTENGKIQVTPGCSKKELLLTPDYQAEYQVEEKGIYHLELTAQTKNGTYTITDSFAVQEEVPFDVERISATRIYPPLNYPVRFTITANQDFSGTITETVPDSFTITPLEGTQSFDMAAKKSVEPSSAAGIQPVLDVSKDSSPAFGEAQNDNTSETASSSATPVSSPPPDTPPISSDSAQLQETILGAFTQRLSLPFLGEIPITLGFGQEPDDPFLLKMYQKFGVKAHDGVDFALAEGTEVLAAERGTVVLAGKGDYGITVVLEHSFGKSYYGHLQKVLVEVGQTVEKGSILGISGSTGLSTGPHLHFGIKPKYANTGNGYKGKIDPASLLGFFNTQAVLGVSTSSFDPTIKVLTWEVSLRKGETITLGYQFKAPQISPQFYTLGPLRFTQSAEPGRNQPGLAGRQTSQPRLTAASGSASFREVFQEARQWMVAADQADSSFLDGASTSIGTSETTIGSLATSLPSGDNIIIAVMAFNATGGNTISASNLKLKKGSTTLASNQYALAVENGPASENATPNDYHFFVYKDTGASASPQYDITAVSNATTMTGEVKMIVINGAPNTTFEDGGSVGVGTSETTILSHAATGIPAGDNIVIATVQLDNSTTAARTIAAGNLKLKKGSTTLASNQYAIDLDKSSNVPHENGYLLVYRDADAAADPTYTVTGLASATGINGEVKITVLSGFLSAFTDTGSVAIGTSETVIGTASTDFPPGDNIVIVANQKDSDNTGGNVNINAGNERIVANSATQSSNAYQLQYCKSITNSVCDEFGSGLLWRETNAIQSQSYDSRMLASTTSLNGESKILVIHVAPLVDQIMRHGKWFGRGDEQGFTF